MSHEVYRHVRNCDIRHLLTKIILKNNTRIIPESLDQSFCYKDKPSMYCSTNRLFNENLQHIERQSNCRGMCLRGYLKIKKLPMFGNEIMNFVGL